MILPTYIVSGMYYIATPPTCRD